MAATLNPTLVKLLDEYADSHRHPINRLTHKLAIPVIVFHVVAMLTWIPLFSTGIDLVGLRTITVGHVVYLAAVAYYLSLNVPLGLIMAALVALCLPLAELAPKPLVVALAVVAWIVQLAGHAVWEKTSPAFLRNMLQALIGPLYFVAVPLGFYTPNYAPSPGEPSTAQ